VNTPRLNPSHAGRYSIYLPRKNGRLSWPSWLDSSPAGSRTSDLSITSPTLNQCNHQDNQDARRMTIACRKLQQQQQQLLACYWCIESIGQTSTSVIITPARWRDSRRPNLAFGRWCAPTSATSRRSAAAGHFNSAKIDQHGTPLILSNHRVSRDVWSADCRSRGRRWSILTPAISIDISFTLSLQRFSYAIAIKNSKL